MGDGKKLSPKAQAELDALNKSIQQAPESNVPAGETQPQNVKKKSEPVAGESTLFPSQINQGQGDQLSPSDGQVPFSGSQPNLGQGATNPPVITEQMKAQAGYGVLSPQQLQKQAEPVKYTKTADKYNEAGVPFALIKANPLVQDEKQESDYNKQMNMQSDLIGQGAPTYNWSAANMVSPVVPLDQSVLSPTTGAALDKITQSSPVIAEKSRKDLYKKNLDEVFENPYSEKDNMSIALGAYDQYLLSIGEYQYESEKMASLQADLAKETPGTEAYNSKLIEIQKMQYQKSTNALAYYGEYINERAAKAEGDLNLYYGDDIALLGTLTERANKLQADGMTDSQEYADIVGQINTINQKPGFVNLVGEYDMYSTMYNQTYDAYSNSITEFPELKAKIERDAVNQELVDLAYQGKISTPGQDFVSLSVNNQVGRSITNLIAGLAYVPKQISGAVGFGETYDWTDKFFDSISGGLEDVNNNFLPTPSGDVNKGVTLANVVRGFSDLAIMAGIATTTAGAGIPVAAGTVAAGVVMTNSEAYKEGIAAGMSNTDSENFAMSVSVTAGVLEMINPEAALFRKSAIKAGAKEFIEAFATGTTKKAAMANAVKKVFKPTLKNIVGENVQEFTQGLADNLVRLSFQKETGADLKAFNDYGQEVVDTILLTSIISAPFGAAGAKTEASTLQRGAMMSAALDPVKYNQVVADMLRQGKVSAYRAEQLKETIGLAAEANKRIPEGIEEEKRPDVLVEMMKKVKQEQVVKNADAAFKAQEEAKLKAQEAIVQQTAGIVTEQKEAKPEAQVTLTPQEETEYENLLAREMTSFSGDKLSQQETIRLQELKNKLTPTQDATQGRIITEDNQQQYQGAQEERQDTGAGRSNIIDEGGQVQQEKVLSSEVTPVTEAVTAINQSLKSANIVAEEITEDQAVALGIKGDGAFLSKDGKIYIVPSRVEKGWGATVVWHEGVHPVLNIINNTDKATYDAMVNGVKEIAKQNESVASVVQWANENYSGKGENRVNDEIATETIARIANGDIDVQTLPTAFRQRVIDFINKIASALGIDPILADTDVETFKKKAKQISDTLKSGRDIAEIVGEENVGMFEDTISEGDLVQERAIDVFNGVLDNLGIQVGTVNPKTGKRKVTNFDVAKALNEYYKKSFNKIKIGDFGKKALDIISEYATDEVLFAISKFGNNSGKGWYTVDFAKALEIMKALDSDIVDNQEIKDAATVAIAIASNSTDVYTNLTRIVYAVDVFKKTGRFPNDIGVGKGMTAIAKSIDTYNKLLDVFGSVDELKKFMSVVRPISESKKALIEKVGANSFQEVKSMGLATDPKWNDNESLPTSIILFGPKIGAFWSNLSGLGGTPTIDRWCIRTMYRYMGDMRAKALPSEMNDFIKTNSLEGQSKGSVISLIQDHAKMFNAILAGKGEYAGQTKEQRNNRLKPYRKGSQIWAKMSGVVNEIEDGLTEKVENKSKYAKSFRSFTKRVFENVQQKVKEKTGESLEISDIQAILWILEKELFGAIGVKQRPESTYSTSAQRLVNELNSGKFTIDQLKRGKITDISSDVEEEGPMGDSYGLPAESFELGLDGQKDRINQDAIPFKGQESAGRRLFSEPVEDIARVSELYKNRKGITTGPGEKITTVDTEEAKRRADAFEQMQNTPNDPQVKAAYQAMATETIDQFDELTKAGYSVEIYEGEGEPYANSQEMLDDLRNNKHLFVLSTEKDFGQNKITDQQRNDNPLLRDSGRKDINGKSLLINDVFRFVHDAFGHGERGNSFGPIGEENAWDVHVRMYSPLAARAMTTETRGQNSWVNFGPHMRNEDGSIKSVPMKDRPFAEQKIGLLPEWVSSMQESKAKRGTKGDLLKDTYYSHGLTEDKGDYIFFHVSSADKKSVLKGIDSRKFYSTRTAREEKGLQYGVASYYTKPTDGETMVGGDKYVVRVPKDKVYPMDTDPNGYRTKAESSTPSNTPFRSEAISRKVAEAAKADGYLMAVGEWNYSRAGEKVSLPEFRADALVPLKPTQEDANSFKANESKKGFKKIEHPEAANIKKLNKTTSLAKKVMDFFSEKGDFGDRYQIASNHAIYEEPITDSDIKEMVKGTSKAIRNEAAALMQESLGERGPKPTVNIKEYNEILSSVDKIKDIKIPGAVNAKTAAIIEDINNALDYGSIDENQAKELRTMLSESSSKARALGIEEFNTAVDSAFASAKQAINTKLEQLGLKTKTPEGMTVAKNSMLDVDALMDLAATMTKKAYAAGVSVDAALKQTMSFIKSTPRYTRLMSNNLITDQEIESIISGEYDRLVMEAERTKRKEKVGTRFQDSPNVSDEIKKAAEEQGFGYVVRNINASWEEAKFIVDFHDQAGELDALIDTMTSSQNKDITDPTRASILAAITDNLLKKAESEQDANVKAGIYKKLQAVVEEGSAMARKAGQTAKIAGELFKRVFGKSVEGTTMMVEEKMRDQIDKIIDRQVPLLRDVIDAIEEANDTKKTKSIVSSLLTDLDAQGVDALTKAINDRLDQGQSITTAFLKSEYKNLLVSQNINDTVKGQIKDLVEKTKLYDEAQAALRTTIKEYNDAKDAATASGTPMTAAQASSYQKQMVAAFIAVNKAQQQAAQANNTLSVYYSDPKNFYKTFATLMQLKLLTAQSFIVNVFSNIVTVPFRLASVAGASMLDYVLTKSAEVITGEKQARRVMLGPQVSAVFNKKNKVIMDALGDIIAKGTTPESVSTLDSKHSLNWNRSAKELTGKIATAMQHKDFESRLSTFFEATFGITADVAARLLALGDVPFKKLAEFGKLEEIGRRKGLKDADLTAFVLDPDEESAKIAKDFGLKVTYQDENIAAEYINSASSYIDKFANEKGAFGYHVAGIMHIMKTAIVPFVKTPLNLLWDTLGYVSPYYSLAQGMVSLVNANKAMRKGETARMQEHIGEFEKSMAKAGVAMAISIIVKALAEAGGLTGDDQDEKIKSMSYSGEAPPQRSMNMSMLMDMLMGKYNPEKERDPSLDVWINYDKLGVLGLAIGTQALVYSEKSKKEIQDMSILVEMTKVVGMPAMKTVMSQSFMKGAFEVMKVVMDGSSEKSFNRYMQATTTAVSSAIYSNTLATLSKATDKYLANTSATENLGESLKLTFKSRLFMGDEIPSRVNIWGDKQPASPVGTNKYAWYFLNATKAKTVDASKATYKVWELYQSTLDKDVLPSPPSRSITVKKESIDLAPDEYERYQIYVGKTRRALTESYILRGNFDNNNNETRAKVLKSSYDKGQEFGKAMFILSTPRLYEMYGYTPKAAKAELDMMQAQLDQAQKK